MSRNLQSRSMFIADDNEALLSAVKRQFENRFQQVCVFNSGENLLDALAHENPDIILLDLKMSGMSGIETLRKIRATHWQPLVIILTAYISSAEHTVAKALGAFDIVVKRVGLDDLDLAVTRALKYLDTDSESHHERAG